MKETKTTTKCYETIKALNLNPRIVEHEPILNYEIAEKVDRELGLTGTETKTLFLQGKSGAYYLFITLAEERMNSKLLKQLLGEKVNMVSGEDMIRLTEMEPGCMTPFGLDDDLIKTVVVDPKIYKEDKLICAFGSPIKSMEIKAGDLDIILNACYQNIINLEEDN